MSQLDDKTAEKNEDEKVSISNHSAFFAGIEFPPPSVASSIASLIKEKEEKQLNTLK